MAAKVIVVGSINMDLVIRSRKIPQPGETIIGGELGTFPGGKGANQAVAAARLGAEVTMVGRVGADVFAGQLKDNLAVAGVDLAYITEDPQAASGVALIVVDNKGQNSIVVASGANARVTVEDVEAAGGAIAAADALLLQLEIPLEAVQRAAEIAHENGTAVLLNPAPAQPLPDDLLALVDILVPNESETALLTNMPVSSQSQMGAAAAELLASGVGAVILTLGERGALLAQGGKTALYPAFVVDRVVDTTAAGDAFAGGLAVALAEGLPVADAVLWGNAAGALTVTRAGAQPSLPTRLEVETLLRQATTEQRQGVVV